MIHVSSGFGVWFGFLVPSSLMNWLFGYFWRMWFVSSSSMCLSTLVTSEPSCLMFPLIRDCSWMAYCPSCFTFGRR